MPEKARRAPNGIRTRAAALKGRCPRPLDDGGSTDIAALPVAPAVGDRPSIGDEPQCRQSGPGRGRTRLAAAPQEPVLLMNRSAIEAVSPSSGISAQPIT